jgi:hypothetical protein
MTPLEDVTQHVVKAPTVWLLGAYGVGSVAAVAAEPGHVVEDLVGLLTGKKSLAELASVCRGRGASTRCLFPLSLGWESIALAVIGGTVTRVERTARIDATTRTGIAELQSRL